ncbi:MAG: adenylyltransferase/cytidyltransferase family protein, partial [Oscillospiraceae bacterium]|nr:adenylyltransferase/cytidyltransferase family protein [Oscillospiraceae bacterium]
MRIGIFGGAFNPPHIGHVSAAKIAIKEQKLDLLIVIPTGTPPHKDLPTETPPPYIRFTMTENAFSDVKKAIVSDIEI